MIIALSHTEQEKTAQNSQIKYFSIVSEQQKK